MDKQTAVHVPSRILPRNKKRNELSKQAATGMNLTCITLSEEKPGSKDHNLSASTISVTLRKCKNRGKVARGWRWWKEMPTKGHPGTLWGDKNILNLDVVGAHITIGACQNSTSFIPKRVNTAQIREIVATKIMRPLFHIQEALQPLNDFP